MANRIIIYEDPGQKAGSFCFTWATPIWGMLAPLFLITLFVELMLTSSVASLGNSLFFALIFLFGLTGTALMKDNRIVISEDGLSLPLVLAAGNGFRNSIVWEDIKRVEFLGSVGDVTTCLIKLTDSSGTINLRLGGMSSEDVEYCLVSLSNWLPAEMLPPELDQLRHNLFSGAASYTQIWEDELAAHFSSTAYLPLACGRLIRGESIKVLKQLSIGGWSAVYLVQEANTRLRVLKEAALPAGRPELRAKAVEMFQREAELLKKLDHPFIVKVYDYFEDEGRQYLLLDYVSGNNLRQLVRAGGAMHWLDIVDYAIRITDVLDYLHSLKPPLVHRDITPENLVVAADGELKLIDFGAANELLGTATGTMVGKQNYMPIEQFRGKATTQSDLYALGATLYFLCTGEDPEPLTAVNPRNSQAGADTEINLANLIQSLTAQNPADRPTSALDVKAKLLAIRR